MIISVSKAVVGGEVRKLSILSEARGFRLANNLFELVSSFSFVSVIFCDKHAEKMGMG